MMSRSWAWCACLILWPTVTAAAADDKLWESIPDKAPIVFQIKGVERVKERLTAMLEKGGPETKALVAEAEATLTLVLQDRKLAGMKADARVYLAVVALPDPHTETGPEVAFFVQVQDYEAFRNGLLTEEQRQSVKKADGIETASLDEGDLFLGRRGDLVVVTQRRGIAAAFVEGADAHPLAKKLPQERADLFNSRDLGIYINLELINKQYEQEIAMARSFLDMGMGQVGELGGFPASAADFFKSMFEGILQAFIDSRLLILSVDCEPEGVRAHLHMSFASGSTTNKTLTGLSRRVALTDLARLPAGMTAYQLGDYGNSWSTMALLSLGFLGSENAGVRAAQKAAVAELTLAEPAGFATAARHIDYALYTWKFGNGALAEKALNKLYGTLQPGESYAMFLKLTKVEIAAEPVVHRGIQFRHIELGWSFADLPQEVVEALKAQMGSGFKAWMGVSGDRWLMALGGDWDTARQHIDRYLDESETIGKLPGFESIANRLPAKATLFSTGDMSYALAQGMVGQGFRAPAKDPTAREVRAADWYGFAIVIDPTELAVDLWLPVSGIAAVIEQAKRSLPDD
ncbi:MAG TPA: hypothetical protein PKD86_18170 [Gemmatales bacterium]|nr:hypothetical protein [Gemmatales bacterium]HMP61276.1 hypothetical protein [Gemmatales bacterium]